MQDLLNTTNRNPADRHHETLGQLCKSYYQLTKPRIIVLLLIETAAAVFLASGGEVDPIVLLATLAGGWFAAASANVINCFYDRDIDQIMERTRWRPIPSGRIRPRDALIFAAVLAIVSFAVLTYFTNLTAALLAQSGIVAYVLIYTHWLKRHTPQNIVIGGAAGAIPPLVGWAAVTGELSWAAWLLFGIIFLWTPPHFWALAIYIRDEYAEVNVPMLPTIVGNAETAKQIWVYTWLTVVATLGLVYPLGVCGAIYAVAAIGLGGVFLAKARSLLQTPDDTNVAKDTFKWSIFYLMLLCLAMAIDSLPFGQDLTVAATQFATQFANQLATQLLPS
jgi:heme o synthase